MIERNAEKDKAMFNFLIDYHYTDKDYICNHVMVYDLNSNRYALAGTPYSFMIMTPEEIEKEAKSAALGNIYRCSNTFIADHVNYCPPDDDDSDAYCHMVDAISHIKQMGADTANKILAELLDMESFLDDLTWHGCDYRAAFDTYGQHYYGDYIIMEFRN